MKMYRALSILCLLLLPALALAAPEPPPVERTLNLYWTDTPPVLDGKPDDACWQQAEVATHFAVLDSLKPPTGDTEVRLCYDAENLYVLWTALEPRMDLLAAGGPEPPNPRARDTSINYTREDVAEFFFDPGRTRKDFVHFMANPAGSRYDSVASSKFNLSLWDFNPNTRFVAGRQDHAWTLEIRIPFGELVLPGGLSGTPQVGDQWGINFGRRRNASPVEFSCWTGRFGQVQRFGLATFRGRRDGATLPTVTPGDLGPLSYGPGLLRLTWAGAPGPVQAAAEVAREGVRAAVLPASVQDHAVTILYRFWEAGDYRLKLRLSLNGQAFYAAEARALLRPGKWVVLKGLEKEIAAGRTLLSRKENRHGAFVRLLRDLDQFDQASRQARSQLAQAQELTGDEWTALGAESAALVAQWKKLQYGLNLARLYPGPVNGRTRLFAVGDATESDKVYRDMLYSGSLTDPIRLKLAGNEWGSFQLAVMPFWRNLTNASLAFSDLRGPGGRVLPADRYLWFRMQYVKVIKDDPYDPTSFHYEPDPLFEAQPFAAPADQITDLWVDYQLPAGTPAGTYTGTVTVSANGQSVSRPVQITARGFDIPVKPTLETDWWLHPFYWDAADGPGATPYTPAVHARQAAVLSRYRISSFPIGEGYIAPQVPIYREADGRFTFDWTTFDQYAKTALAHNSTAFWSALACGSGWPMYLNQPGLTFTNRATGQKQTLAEIYQPPVWDWTKPETYANNPIYRAFLPAYAQHLKDLGIDKVSYFECWDESADQPRMLLMLEHYGFIRKLAPGLQLFNFGYTPFAEYDGHDAFGILDGWGPQVGWLDTRPTGGQTVAEACQERRAQYGEKFWAYTCGEARDPDGNYAPFLVIDHSYLALRMHGWIAWNYRLDGYLLFMLAGFKDVNPSPDPMQRFPNSEYVWASSPWLGHLVYPAPNYEVIPSQRLALARKGLEDFEYFKLLEKEARGLDPVKNATLLARVKTALALEPAIWTDQFHWTKDRDLLEAKRDRLATLIREVQATQH